MPLPRLRFQGAKKKVDVWVCGCVRVFFFFLGGGLVCFYVDVFFAFLGFAKL